MLLVAESTHHHPSRCSSRPARPREELFTGRNVSTESMITHSTADLIRRAEEDIAAGKHLLALGLLAEAARREPTNPVIGALVVRADRGIERVCAVPAPHEGGMTDSQRRAQLATLAMRGEFGEGIGLLASDAPDPATDGRVKLLTTVATNLFERGAFEEAVQALMKAHMLDPRNPNVEACERLLSPALETMRKRPAVPAAVRRSVPDEEDTGRGDLSAYLQRQTLSVSRPAIPPADGSALLQAGGESRRLEALRARQDLERRKREIMRWREASGPPGRHAGKKSHGQTATEAQAPKRQHDPLTAHAAGGSARQPLRVGQRIPQPPTEHASPLSSFFSKLRQGKLFG